MKKFQKDRDKDNNNLFIASVNTKLFFENYSNIFPFYFNLFKIMPSFIMGLGIIRSAEEFIWNNHGAILQEMINKFYQSIHKYKEIFKKHQTSQNWNE